MSTKLSDEGRKENALAIRPMKFQNFCKRKRIPQSGRGNSGKRDSSSENLVCLFLKITSIFFLAGAAVYKNRRDVHKVIP